MKRKNPTATKPASARTTISNNTINVYPEVSVETANAVQALAEAAAQTAIAIQRAAEMLKPAEVTGIKVL